jgi:LPXTG-motif cell wall-anchored protein
MARDKNNEGGILKGIFAGYLILVLHALLMLLVALLVVFLRGVVEYMLWIFLGGLTLIGLSGYVFYRRIKKGSGTLGSVLNDPAFRDRPMEISFLGGLASVKLGQPGQSGDSGAPRAIEAHSIDPIPQLEDDQATRRRELARLVLMLEKNLITQQEYDRLKQDLLDN